MIERLFLLFAILFTAFAKCPLNWAEYQGKCVYLSRDTREWIDASLSLDMAAKDSDRLARREMISNFKNVNSAQVHCRNMGAYLATDDSEEKHNYLTQLVSLFHVFNEKVFWIGGDDYIFEGTWRWTETGSTIGPFAKWKAGSPSQNTSKNCLALTWEGDSLYWFDDHCRYWRQDKITGGRYFYICEKPVPQDGQPVIG